MIGNDLPVDYYTVQIQGKEKLLYFEHIDPRFTGRLGRWFVEKIVRYAALDCKDGQAASLSVFICYEECNKAQNDPFSPTQ